MPIRVSPVGNPLVKKLNFQKNTYPQCNDPDVPRHFWVGLFVGSRASGKTYCCVQLLKQYEKCGVKDEYGRPVEQRIILFSPTISANPIWSSLKHLSPEDMHDTYDEETLRDVIQDIQMEHEATLKYQEDMELYNKFLNVQSIDQLRPDELIRLATYDFNAPIPPKYSNGVVNYILLDDLVGSSALKNGRSYLNYIIIRNRHMRINVGILVQSMKSVPKIIRNNTNLFCIWQFANRKMVVEDLYEEVSNTLTEDNFEEIYDHATNDPDGHSCLVIDFSQPKEKRFKKSFNEILSLE
jgi:hypothetical protein